MAAICETNQKERMMSDVVEERIAEIRARVEAAAKGPWKRTNSYTLETCMDCDAEPFCCDVECEHEIGTPYASLAIQLYGIECLAIQNAEFIAHAREDVPYLLNELAAAQERVAELKQVVTELAAWHVQHPKGRVYPIGPNDCEKQLDAICERAMELTKGMGYSPYVLAAMSSLPT